MLLKKKLIIASLAMVALAPLASQADNSDMFAIKAEFVDYSTGRPVLGKLLDPNKPGELSQIELELPKNGSRNACVKEAIEKVSGLLATLQSGWVAAKASYSAATACGKDWNTSYQIVAKIDLNAKDLNPMTVNGRPTNPNLGKQMFNVEFLAQSVSADGKTTTNLPINGGEHGDRLPRNNPDEGIHFTGYVTDTPPNCARLQQSLLDHVNISALTDATTGAIKRDMTSCSSASGSDPLATAMHVAPAAQGARDNGPAALPIMDNTRWGHGTSGTLTDPN